MTEKQVRELARLNGWSIRFARFFDGLATLALFVFILFLAAMVYGAVRATVDPQWRESETRRSRLRWAKEIRDIDVYSEKLYQRELEAAGAK